MAPDDIEPFPLAVFCEAMEFVIGRPLPETELDELLRQLSEAS